MQAREHSAGPDRFAGVRRKFRDTIDERIVFFETARRDIEVGRNPPGVLRAMAEEAHRISGVAATLGFPALGTAAARLESEILAGMSRGSMPPTFALAILPLTEELLDLLEGALAE